jgi:hypothetical protein
MIANAWYGTQIIRGMDFKIQLLKTFGYGRRLSLFHLHKPQLPGYLILKSGKEVAIYRPNGAGRFIQSRYFPAGKVDTMAFYKGINFAVLSCLGQEGVQSFLAGADHSQGIKTRTQESPGVG